MFAATYEIPLQRQAEEGAELIIDWRSIFWYISQEVRKDDKGLVRASFPVHHDAVRKFYIARGGTLQSRHRALFRSTDHC